MRRVLLAIFFINMTGMPLADDYLIFRAIVLDDKEVLEGLFEGSVDVMYQLNRSAAPEDRMILLHMMLSTREAHNITENYLRNTLPLLDEEEIVELFVASCRNAVAEIPSLIGNEVSQAEDSVMQCARNAVESGNASVFNWLFGLPGFNINKNEMIRRLQADIDGWLSVHALMSETEND